MSKFWRVAQEQVYLVSLVGGCFGPDGSFSCADGLFGIIHRVGRLPSSCSCRSPSGICRYTSLLGACLLGNLKGENVKTLCLTPDS